LARAAEPNSLIDVRIGGVTEGGLQEAAQFPIC
jgi:hypothetical protein